MPNPYHKPFKIRWIDRFLTIVGNVVVGGTSSLLGGLSMDRDGLGDGFFHRPHTRAHLKDAEFKDFTKLTARHGFRMELSHKVAYVIAPVLASVSAIAGLIVALAMGVK